MTLKKGPFENIQSEEETSIFFFSHNVFYLIQHKFWHLDHI